MLKVGVILACAGLAAGCAGNADLIKALSGDPAANCVSITTVYGAVTMARGTPETAVSVSNGQCAIKGSKSAAESITVPVQIQVLPTK